MYRFKNKTVWITGSETPIGQKCAEAFYKEGANLLLSGTDKCVIKECGPQFIRYNSTNPYSRKDALDALNQIEKLDILVTANRRIEKVTIKECTEKDFDENIDENLTCVFNAVREAAKKIGMYKGGVITVISTVHGEKPTGSAFLYSVANGGLNMLVKEGAQDLGRIGIRINMLRTGPLLFEVEALQSEISGLYHEPEKRIPFARLGEISEMVEPVLFLSSDAASFVNGAILTADGGFIGFYNDGDSERRFSNGFLQ